VLQIIGLFFFLIFTLTTELFAQITLEFNNSKFVTLKFPQEKLIIKIPTARNTVGIAFKICNYSAIKYNKI